VAVIVTATTWFGYQHFSKSKKASKMVVELKQDFEKLRDQAFKVYLSETNGRIWWNEQKPWIIEKYGDDSLPGATWKHPALTDGFDPNDLSEDFVNGDNATPLHFLNQLKRIPLQQIPNARRILQIALNVGQGMASGSVKKTYTLNDFIEFK
jgi:hypothetical protein